MQHVDFQYAPGARWSAKQEFGAPIGTDGKRMRYISIGRGTRVVIDGVLDFQTKLMIGPALRPTDFTQGRVWMDKVWVGRDWLQQNFDYASNDVFRLFSFERYGSPYSALGVQRLLTDDDAMLELAIAANKNVTDILCAVYRSGCTKQLYSLHHAFDMLRILREASQITGYSDEWYEGVNFEHMLQPWAGLIVVDNGNDFTELVSRFPRKVTSSSYGQKTIFVIEDDDTFFHTKLSMKKPMFLHRERTAAAL